MPMWKGNEKDVYDGGGIIFQPRVNMYVNWFQATNIAEYMHLAQGQLVVYAVFFWYVSLHPELSCVWSKNMCMGGK
jgi:hypothetical protein